MSRGVFSVLLVVGIAAAAGCTGVQKGTVAGGGLGAGTGAMVGHSVGHVGSGPAALVGFGVGAVGGAIAGEYMYGEDDTEELAAASRTIQQLEANIRARDAKLGQAASELEKEKAQQKALLEAYDQASSGAAQPDGRATLSAAAPSREELTITLQSSVLFGSGSAKLSKEGRAALKATAQSMRNKYPGATYEVRGHTDSVPIKYSPYKSNWELSYARAVAVVQYLVESEGFAPTAFKATGLGDTQPVAPNTTASGRSRNRRAEIVVHPRGESEPALGG